MTANVPTRLRERTESEWLEFSAFAERYELPRTDTAAVLYLTDLADAEELGGRLIRARLRLLDVAFATHGIPPLVRSRQVRMFLRGLHQVAPIGPVRERSPLYLEDVLAMLDGVTEVQPGQAEARAFVLLANATGLPASILRQLTWNDIRVRRDRLMVNAPPCKGSRGPRGRLSVAASEFPATVRAVRDLRRLVGPSAGRFFAGSPARPTSEKWANGLLAGLSARGGPWSKAMSRSQPEVELSSWVELVASPTPSQRRLKALIALSFAACLTAVEAGGLRCGDVDQRPEGLLVSVPGRRQPVAVPRAHGRHCPVRYWDEWLGVLAGCGRAAPTDPAFPHFHGGLPTTTALQPYTLSQLIAPAARAAGLQGTYVFTSLRIGFIRTAVRAGVPEVLILNQAGMETMTGLGKHLRRERLISHSVAGRVGL